MNIKNVSYLFPLIVLTNTLFGMQPGQASNQEILQALFQQNQALAALLQRQSQQPSVPNANVLNSGILNRNGVVDFAPTISVGLNGATHASIKEMSDAFKGGFKVGIDNQNVEALKEEMAELRKTVTDGTARAAHHAPYIAARLAVIGVGFLGCLFNLWIIKNQFSEPLSEQKTDRSTAYQTFRHGVPIALLFGSLFTMLKGPGYITTPVYAAAAATPVAAAPAAAPARPAADELPRVRIFENAGHAAAEAQAIPNPDLINRNAQARNEALRASIAARDNGAGVGLSSPAGTPRPSETRKQK